MKQIFLNLHLLIAGVLMLSGCGSTKLDHYKDMQPKVSIDQFFSGSIKGWGIVQDRSGKVIQRFDVSMVGTWDGNEGVLDEDFVYYDGREEKRIWRITKNEDGTYTGRADDIVDTATGREAGNAIQWQYQMDLDVDGSTYRITFDDWMYLMNDDVLINRSHLKKFGIEVAELTLFMRKEGP